MKTREENETFFFVICYKILIGIYFICIYNNNDRNIGFCDRTYKNALFY